MEADQRRSIPVIRLLWRHFTGLHYDGRRRKNGRGGKVLPQYRDYYWNRYSRGRRAAWRHGLTWGLLGITYGLIVARSITLWCLLAWVPFICVWAGAKTLRHVARRVTAIDHDGVSETYWTLRPKYAAYVRRVRSWRWRWHGPVDEPLPALYERPTLAQIADDGGEPVTRLRRPVDMGELLKSQGPADRRSRTIKRSMERRQK